MEINFIGKRALVTGAGQGIGKEVAVKLLQCGANVVAADKNEMSLEELKKEFPAIGTVCVDLSDWKLTKNTISNLGSFDLLVNNAGISIIEDVGEVTEEAYDSIMNINVKSLLNISQVVCKDMKTRGKGGAVVNLSSQASIIALDGHVAYCASKGAVNMITKVMSKELGPYQIRTNAVCPTVVNTELGRRLWKDQSIAAPMMARIPMGKFAEPCHIADTILFLLSDQAEMINGAILPIDGGATAC